MSVRPGEVGSGTHQHEVRTDSDLRLGLKVDGDGATIDSRPALPCLPACLNFNISSGHMSHYCRAELLPLQHALLQPGAGISTFRLPA